MFSVSCAFAPSEVGVLRAAAATDSAQLGRRAVRKVRVLARGAAVVVRRGQSHPYLRPRSRGLIA